VTIPFPSESAEYRRARIRLLEQEIEPRRATEAVAQAPRGHPMTTPARSGSDRLRSVGRTDSEVPRQMGIGVSPRPACRTGAPLSPLPARPCGHPDDAEPFSLIGRKLSPSFRLEHIILAPGAERPADAVTQRLALVVVEQGDVELELTNRLCRRFASGAVLYTAGLRLRLIRNVGANMVLMSFLARRADEESP
jgi:hypothetical protein